METYGQDVCRRRFGTIKVLRPRRKFSSDTIDVSFQDTWTEGGSIVTLVVEGEDDHRYFDLRVGVMTGVEVRLGYGRGEVSRLASVFFEEIQIVSDPHPPAPHHRPHGGASPCPLGPLSKPSPETLP